MYICAHVDARVCTLGEMQTHASIVIWGGNNENEGALQWYNRRLAIRRYEDPLFVANIGVGPSMLPIRHRIP